MVKPILLVLGAIPAIVAILIAIPIITKPDIPFSASVPSDIIEIEFTKHNLKKVSFGVTERTIPQTSEILIIQDNGDVRYTITRDGDPQPDKYYKLDEATLKKLSAIIKETGFMEIPSESFPVSDDVDNYERFSVKVTLNGAVKQIFWPEQNATKKFVPPIITLVETELKQVISKIN